jgi:predicted XRE-type DNA-binding protein
MSFNVFEDAGYPRDVATIKALRSDLARAIAGFIRRQGMTQVRAAHALGIPQPTVSKIINGRVAELSIEFLLRTLVRVDIPVVMQTGTSASNALAEVNVGRDLAEKSEAEVGVTAASHTAQTLQFEQPGDVVVADFSVHALSGTTKDVLNG